MSPAPSLLCVVVLRLVGLQCGTRLSHLKQRDESHVRLDDFAGDHELNWVSCLAIASPGRSQSARCAGRVHCRKCS